MGKFAASNERQKVKIVSASGGFEPTLLTRGSTSGVCRPPFIGPHSCIWGFSNSLAPVLIKRIYERALIFLNARLFFNPLMR